MSTSFPAFLTGAGRAPDRHDLFWQGDDSPHKYPLRRQLVGLFPALQRDYGVRIFSPLEPLNATSYAEARAASRLVLSTPLKDWLLVGTRYFEVMAGGSALLLCYREPTAYAPLGIVEGEHALMFSDIDEFVATLRRHSLGNTNASAAAVDERRAMAKRARELVLARHTWPHRAEEVVTVLRSFLL